MVALEELVAAVDNDVVVVGSGGCGAVTIGIVAACF